MLSTPCYWLQGLTDPPGVAQTDVPGLQLALAVIASLYVLRDRKRLDLGNGLQHQYVVKLRASLRLLQSDINRFLCFNAVRAGGITVAGLIVGAVVGSALQSWLRVDIVPIGVMLVPLWMYGACNDIYHLMT